MGDYDVKRQALVAMIGKSAAARGVTFRPVRQGASHEIWVCGGKTFPIPRHREINEHTAHGIVRSLEPWLGKDWWRS